MGQVLIAITTMVAFAAVALCLVPDSEGITTAERLWGFRWNAVDWDYQPRHDGTQVQVAADWTPGIGRQDTVHIPQPPGLYLVPALPAKHAAPELSPWFAPRHLGELPQARGRHTAPEQPDLVGGLRSF